MNDQIEYKEKNTADRLITGNRVSNASVSASSLLAAFAVLLIRYNYQNEIQFLFTVSDHPISHGFHWHHLKAKTYDDLTFIDVLNLVTQFMRNDSRETSPKETSPQDATMLCFQIQFSVDKEDNHDILLSNIAVTQKTNDDRTSLPSIELIDQPDHIEVSIIYYTDIPDAQLLSNLVRHYRTIIKRGLAQPEEPISRYQILGQDEINKIIYEWNATDAHFPQNKCLHQLIEEQAEMRPESTAIIWQDKRFSYRELNDAANQIASSLLELSVKPDDCVAVFLSLSFNAVAAILGVLKAGAAYIPVDVEWPAMRVDYILRQSDTVAVITDKGKRNKFQFTEEHVIFIDEINCNASSGCAGNPVTNVSPSNLAYVIYTSGTTNVPKGVLIQHDSLMNNISLVVKRYQITEQDTVLAMPMLAFDASVSKLFPILSVGGSVILPTKDEAIDAEKIQERIERYHIPYLVVTPSTIRILNIINPDLSKLKMIACGGEPLKYGYISNIIKQVPVLNIYGPTEATVSSCTHLIPQNPSDTTPQIYRNRIPIGKPNPNCKVYILDKHHNVMPVGCFGTLFIGGVGVSRGYLNDSELTARKFISNPYVRGGKMYDTGDICRWLPDGNIDLIGREDNQVKIRGFRVSLEEIENVMSHFSEVSKCKLIVSENAEGENQLTAFISPRLKNSPQEIFRDYAKRHLPYYMIPSEFILMDDFPLNSNNKIDEPRLHRYAEEIIK